MLKVFRFEFARRLVAFLLSVGVMFALLAVVAAAARAQGIGLAATTFACGGTVETAVWKLWDAQGRAFLRNELLASQLIKQGDSYALYDIQDYLHNLEAMAHRCGRTGRLIQLADDLIKAYGVLEPLNGHSTDMAWVCKGGAVCNDQNRLINKEVILVSVQGLGLMSALANALVTSNDPKARAHPFITKTAEVSVQHLLRWSDKKAMQDWQRLISAKAEDVENGSSALFFSDQILWQIAIYANLAGIYSAHPALRKVINTEPNQQAQLKDSIRALLQLFKARTSFENVKDPLLGSITTADLDRGFWRLHADNRYAGYTANEKPAICDTKEGSPKAKLVIKAQSVPIVKDIGWDISHARRLVHALDALQKNRVAIQQVYDLRMSELPAPDITKTFAAQLVSRVWNGDKDAPLFANYWSGANGWYRVAYDNGTGRCDTGNPPFGLSDSFATGGYAVWSKVYPVIGELARTIYGMTKAKDSASLSYTEKYFSGMAPRASADTRMLNQLMFWPSLVQ